MNLMKIIWIKEVKDPHNDKYAYDDIMEGDIFYLHWPKNTDSNIQGIQIDEVMLLKQKGMITHVVTPVSSEILTSANIEYPKCREVYCIKKTEIAVEKILGRSSYDQGKGRHIQTELGMNDIQFQVWQKTAISLLGLSINDLTNDNQWNGYSENEYLEGRKKYKQHIIRERNRAVINEKKEMQKKVELNLNVNYVVLTFLFMETLEMILLKFII